MKKLTFLTATAAALIITAACGQRQSKAAETADVKIDIRTWPRMPIDEFGCMMERTFEYRHERFNCSLKNYENNGDPCVNYEEYYEGFEFPENLAKKVHPWMKSISLDWEDGRLQAVSFQFDGEHSEEQILSEFGIDPDDLPDNMITVDAENNNLFIQGFWHMGAGDVGCDELDDEDDEDDENRHPIDIQMDKDIEKDSSNGGLFEAYRKATKAWEEEMNKNYQTLMAQYDNDNCRKKLQKAQEAWLAFWKDETHFNGYFWYLFDGSMYATSSTYYNLYLIRKRAFELVYYYDKYPYSNYTYFDENTDVKTEEEWDKMLNEQYKLLMARLKKDNQDRLRTAQRKWIVYRDAEDDCYNSCNPLFSNPDYRLLIVRERALRFEKYVNDYDECPECLKK